MIGARRLKASAMSERPSLSIVVPAFNEERRLGTSLRAIRDEARRREAQWQVVVIDDGSSDGTANVARTFDAGPLDLTVMQKSRNRGKGHSARRGVLATDGDIVLLTDADLSTPIEELDKLLEWFERGYDIVIGSRDLPESVLDPRQPLKRRIMGVTFRSVRRLILLPGLRDTQCGFKAYRREVAKRVFSLQRSTGFGFDCEILGLAEQMGYRIKETGVVWRDDTDSRVRPVRDSIQMLWELVWTRRRLRELRNGVVDRDG